MPKQNGFTLIELMIVVAIVAVLAATAIPAYQDYAKRSRVTEGLSLANGLKTAVTEYKSTQNMWPNANEDLGLGADISGNGVTSVLVGAGGVITITYNSKVSDGRTMILAPAELPSGGVKWSCTGGSLELTLRPTECRAGS